MTFNELPLDVQECLTAQQKALCAKSINDSYEIRIYNEAGTRYFYARRKQNEWSDDNGNYMPFGGGSSWHIRYGMVQFCRIKSTVGTCQYEWTLGKVFGKSANGTVIPRNLKTKKEVLELIKAIGIFHI